MKQSFKSILILSVLAVGLGLYYWFSSSDKSCSSETRPTPNRPTPEQIQSTVTPPPPLFGESLLIAYGGGDPSNDLRKIEAVVANYRVLAKGMDARHFSSNAELSSTLRGEKRIALKALPEDHSIFNNDGLIVDRWDTPLFFHLEATDKLSIYSAGPDKEMGTEDDYSLIGGVTTQGKTEF